MVKLWPTVYKEAFNEVFKEVYSIKKQVCESDMIISKERLLEIFRRSGRTLPTAKGNIRELVEYGAIVALDNDNYKLIRNPYGVDFEDLIPVDGLEDLSVIRHSCDDLDKFDDKPYVGMIIKEGTLHTTPCCPTMSWILSKDAIRFKNDEMTMFGTKINYCPWCGRIIIHK